MHNIFLTGLSGSGKSTVGRILAERLGKPLFDIDTLIEKEFVPVRAAYLRRLLKQKMQPSSPPVEG